MYKLLVSYSSSPNHFEAITDIAYTQEGTIVLFDTRGTDSCTFDPEEAEDLKNKLVEYSGVAYVRLEEVK